ncbi:MAG: FmdB family zinc ribbon protein [Kiritimatiellia bacterium]
MPIYEYQATHLKKACDHCRSRFEVLQRISDKPLASCPACGTPVLKCISAPRVGASQSNFDDRAKSAGFHKLKKRSKGEYEKEY